MSTPVDPEIRYRALDDDRNVVGKGILPALTEEDALDALRHGLATKLEAHELARKGGS